MVKYDLVKQCQALIDLEPLLVKVVEDQQCPPVTCIIADVFVICTPAVAKRFHIPHLVFWTQSAASYATHTIVTQNYASLRGQLFPEELQYGEAKEGKLIRNIPGCPPLKLREVPTFLQAMDPADFLFNYLIRNFDDALDADYVLMNTFEELEAESMASIAKPPALAIGPMLPAQFVLSRDGDEDRSRDVMVVDKNPNLIQRRNGVVVDENPNLMKRGSSLWVEDEQGCLPWLDLQKPKSVLYVSFGSITYMSARQIHEFALGLEAGRWPFLMVLRPELTVDDGGGRRATTTFLSDFVHRMRSHARAAFVEWAPQLQVLAHPAIGGFLTHCGWNSTLESISMGVPMLCWPYFADQMINCRCIVDVWKLGLEFDTKELEDETSSNPIDKDDDIDGTSKSKDNITKVVRATRHEIERKVDHLMDPNLSKEIRERANTLSLAAKEAYKGPCQQNLNLLLHFLFTYLK
nr:glycosyltransferase [Odontosoria chusana]